MSGAKITPPRAAIYARFSRASQDATSIDVQVRNCRRVAEQQGFRVVEVFKDEGISGADDNRPGYLALLRYMEDKKADCVLINETSRLTRSDNGEFQRVQAELSFRDQFVMDAKGYDSRSEFAPVFGALMNAFDSTELRKLRRRTGDALRERALKGRCAGGVPYGYRTKPVSSSNHKTLVIHDREAEVVRSIFEMAAEGCTTRNIAAEMNRRGVPTSGRRKRRTPGKWMHTTVRGMLRNRTYVGDIVWGRVKIKRAPGKGSKKIRVRLSEADWARAERPDLRIVDQAIWDRVQKRIAAAKERSDQQRQRNRKRGCGGTRYTRLLSGLLKCGECGGAYVITDRTKYGCLAHRSGGEHACGNQIRVKRTLAESKILQSVKDGLLSPDVTKRVRKYMQEELRRQKKAARETAEAGGELRDRVRELKARIANATETIVALGLKGNSAMAKQLARDEDDLAAAEARMARASASRLDGLPDIIPDAVARYRAEVERMEQLGDDPDPKDVIRAREWLRDHLGDVRLTPHPEGYLVAQIDLQSLALPLAAGGTDGGACYRWCPEQESNL